MVILSFNNKYENINIQGECFRNTNLTCDLAAKYSENKCLIFYIDSHHRHAAYNGAHYGSMGRRPYGAQAGYPQRPFNQHRPGYQPRPGYQQNPGYPQTPGGYQSPQGYPVNQGYQGNSGSPGYPGTPSPGYPGTPGYSGYPATQGYPTPGMAGAQAQGFGAQQSPYMQNGCPQACQQNCYLMCPRKCCSDKRGAVAEHKKSKVHHGKHTKKGAKIHKKKGHKKN